MPSARKRAFEIIPETCPDINSAAGKVDAAYDALTETWVDFRIEEEATRKRFRDALIDAYMEVDDLESKHTILTGKVQDLEDEVKSLKLEIKRLEGRQEDAA